MDKELRTMYAKFSRVQENDRRRELRQAFEQALTKLPAEDKAVIRGHIARLKQIPGAGDLSSLEILTAIGILWLQDGNHD